MLNNPIYQQIVLLIIASLPISYLIIRQIGKFSSPSDSRIAKTTTILTNLLGTLTKEHLEVDALLFNNYKATPKDKSELLDIQDFTTQETISVEKVFLKTDQAIAFASIASTMCHYQKLERIENVTNQFFRKCGFFKENIENEYAKIEEIPTNAEKKISTIVALNTSTKEIFSFTKGNSKSVLERCDRIIMNGKKIDLTTPMKSKIKARIKKMTKNGYKLIAFAYKALPLKRLDTYSEDFTEKDMIFLGIVGFSSPLNTETKSDIAAIKNLGIKTYILTTLPEKNAVPSGIELGLVNESYFEAISSSDLKDISDQKLEKMLQNKEKDYIFTELTEDDKLRISKTLKDLNEHVTSITRENGNSFNKILTSIKNSRSIIKNLRTLKYHAISCKVAEVFIIIAALILKVPSPLSIYSILAIELLINLFLEFALLKERYKNITVPNKVYVPKNTKISILRVLSNAIPTGIVVILVYMFNLTRYGYVLFDKISTNEGIVIKSTTVAFLILIISQILNAYHLRGRKSSLFSIKKLISNHYLILSTIITGLFTYIFISFPETQTILNVSTITKTEWQLIIFVIVILVILEEVHKFFKRRKDLKNGHSNS